MTSPTHIVAVTGFITNPEGKILMILNPRRGWEIPGGKVEEGESLITALQREIMEEAGIEIHPTVLGGVYSNLVVPTKVIFVFFGEWVSGEIKPTDESLQTEWVAREEMLERITHPAIYDRVQSMLAFTGQVIYKAYTLDPLHIYETRNLT